MFNETANISNAEKMAEAIRRMRMLGISECAIKHFREEGTIPYCFSSKNQLYGIQKSQDLDIVECLREQHNALVYFIIHTNTDFGEMESYLFVNDYKEEWKMDNEDLEDGYALTWTENRTYPECSEFGSIAIELTPCGGLRRVG